MTRLTDLDLRGGMAATAWTKEGSMDAMLLLIGGAIFVVVIVAIVAWAVMASKR